MHSLRTRITMLTVCVTVIAVTLVSLASVLFIQSSKHRESEQMLLMLCETGQRNLDYYFNSVQQAVGKVSVFAESDIDGLDTEKLRDHVERTRKVFDEMANRASGVLTYYYRIDPAISDNVKGYWYTNVDGTGYKEHEVTDINLYDTEDTSQLVWFTVPKDTGEPAWLPPYITENLDKRVISYNVPICFRGQFIGVVGIEIDYSMMAEQVESIRLYNNGYAFLSDKDGVLFFHPRIDVTQLAPEDMPKVPENAVSDSTFLYYTFDGVKKQAAWLPLCNGMRINVAVPISETDGDWQKLIWEIFAISAVVLLTLCAFTLFYTSRITKPLQDLTEAAEQLNRGNYDFNLEYSRDDEVGKLTATFSNLAAHMKAHINDLNKRAYVDALTSVRNKGAFTDVIEKMQKKMDGGSHQMAFAVGVFDCDNLKIINDQYGHDKGDIYLKSACRLICQVFQHSPVFRTGGDEFAVILENDDFRNRENLTLQFYEEAEEIRSRMANPWERVTVSMGIAVYDPSQDHTVIDTVRRADRIMYMEKRERKQARHD